MIYLSKSDFLLASTCPKKLVYKKAYYPTANDTNEYLKMLAQGGYVVGHMATLLYPEGFEITGNTQECIAQTKELMKQENVVLFEPAIQSGQKLVRIDILVKEAMNLHLIEVKAKSHDTDEDNSKAKLTKYIEDVAYQYLVLTEAYPEYNIRCSMLMPDKARRTSIDGMAGWFSIEKDEKKTDLENEQFPAQQKPRFIKPKVIFKYEDHPEKDKYIQELIEEGILDYLDVNEEVIALQNEIRQRAGTFIRILNDGITEQDYQINKKCKECEFNTTDEDRNGFEECWGDMAYNDPHIFDLYYGGGIGHYTKGFYYDELISEGKSSLYDIDIERLRNISGEFGVRAERQLLQIKNTKENSEWISPELSSKIKELPYPIHFIDFETYTGALPFHKGMRPYELIAFQWSCHTIKHEGETPEHEEWIHTGSDFPNFEFAKSLMEHIENTSTPLMWSHHENTVLRTILDQMDIFSYEDEKLKVWLTNMTHDKNREGRWVDMNTMTQQYYFHPDMKGRTSIKKVLPAVWSNHSYLYNVPHFKDFAPKKHETGIIDPYDKLTAGIEYSETDDEVVKEGTAAMRAYQRIRFDDTIKQQQKDEIKSQLLQYCKLDTLAMVIIGYHWGMR